MAHGNDRYTHIEEQVSKLKNENILLNNKIEHIQGILNSLMFKLENVNIDVTDIIKEL